MFHVLPFALVLGILLGPSPRARAVPPTEKPNIVYILADDLGYGDVRAFNPARGKIPTPHLDRLAAEGIAFTDAHSGSSVCTPTRYGLLTGRYAWRSRLQRGVLDGGDDPPLIAPDRLTVGAFLRARGYATAAIGKWHLGFTSTPPDASAGGSVSLPTPPESASALATTPASTSARRRPESLPVGSRIVGGPITRGFDYFWGCSNARTISALIENDRVIENLPPVEMLPRLGRRAVEYIGERAAAARAGTPFFLYVPLTSPHGPVVPAPAWQDKSGLGPYGDFVMQTDAVVGDLLGAIARHGLAENTLVIFTADNGCSPTVDPPALEKLGHFVGAGFRGYKADIWEGGHRVPFLARWPGRIAPGGRSAQLLCHTDFLATCAELLAVPLPPDAGEDSVSFLPALLGRDRAPRRESVVHHSIDGLFAIREGPWKLALCPGSGGWGSPLDSAARVAGLPEIQLYDLVADPAETTNLQAAHPAVVARLRALLERTVAAGRSTPGPAQPNDVAIDLLKLPAR